MKEQEWINLRASLHHDWMQKYLTFLYARRDSLSEMISGEVEWRDDIKEQLFEWFEKKELFMKLFDSCEDALSPRQLFDEPPINTISEGNKEWLGELIHELYAKRTHIRENIGALKNVFDDANAAFEHLIRCSLEGHSSAKYFLNKLTEFSKAISKLPHKTQVV